MKKSWFWPLLLLLVPHLAVAQFDNFGNPITPDEFGNPGTVATPLKITPNGVKTFVGEQTAFTASDGSGKYTWQAVQGRLSPTQGTAVVYTAPQCDNGCKDVVTVTDTHGNSETANIDVRKPPISAGTCTISPTEVDLYPGKRVEFTMAGNDNDITWTVDGGNITKRGKTAIFWADTVSTYHITGTDMLNPKCSATATIDVDLSCNITPETSVIPVGKSQQFDMVGYNCDDVSWVASAGTIQDGRYIAPLIPGDYTITATVNTTGYSETARITVTPECSITPERISLQPVTSQLITVTSGIGPYSPTASFGTIEKFGSDPQVFQYTASHETGAGTVTICCGDGQQCGKTNIFVGKMRVDLPKKVQINTTYPFKVTGGKAPYTKEVDFGTINWNEYSGKGAYTAPKHTTTATITVYDKDNNSTEPFTVEVIQYSPPTISPSVVPAIALGETWKFSVVGGTGPFEWNYEGIEKHDNSNTRYTTITAKGTIGPYYLWVRDTATGMQSEKVAVQVNRSLKVTPRNYTVYKGVSDRKTAMRFTKSGGADGTCAWISDSIEIDTLDGFPVEIHDTQLEAHYVTVTALIQDRPDGTQYTVTCIDKNGAEASAIITVAKLAFDSDDNGFINSAEAQRAIEQHFEDRVKADIDKMDRKELFHHLDNFR